MKEKGVCLTDRRCSLPGSNSIVVIAHERIDDKQMNSNALAMGNDLVTYGIFERRLGLRVFTLNGIHNLMGNKIPSMSDSLTIVF